MRKMRHDIVSVRRFCKSSACRLLAMGRVVVARHNSIGTGCGGSQTDYEHIRQLLTFNRRGRVFSTCHMTLDAGSKTNGLMWICRSHYRNSFDPCKTHADSTDHSSNLEG
jgi:hypothetical protein